MEGETGQIAGATSYWARNRSNMLLLAVTLIVCFAAMEAFFRFFMPTVGDPPDLFIPDQNLLFRMRPNFTGYYIGGEHGKTLIQTNSRGYRDVEHPPEKPPGTYRILGIGDSVTVGNGNYYNETYLAMLEERLNGRGGKRYEIIKTGVGSWDMDQIYPFLVDEGLGYDPDLVIYGLCLNDIHPHGNESLTEYRFGSGPQDPMYYLRWAQRNCYSCNFIWKTVRYSPLFYDREKHDQEYRKLIFGFWDALGTDYTDRRLMMVVNATRERNVSLVIVVFPFGNQFGDNAYMYPQELIANFSANQNVTVVDMYPIFRFSGNASALYLPGDLTHFKGTGHSLVAERLEPTVRRIAQDI